MRAVAAETRPRGLVAFSGAPVADAKADAANSYLDRIKAYIPAEVVAFFIFVNSLVLGSPLRSPGAPSDKTVQESLTIDGMVAIASLALGVLLSFLYARVAAKGGDTPWRVQGLVTAIAFLVWSYAIGGQGYAALNLHIVPSLAGLLLAAFTIVSGFIIPIKSPAV